MKFFKYTVLALALAAGFSACSEDDDYTAGAASDGVYFPDTDALEVTLDRNVNSFDVIVARAGESAAATYAITGVADDEVFTLPTSVSFAEGETTTTVAVSYKQSAMGLDKPYTVKLAFPEGTQTYLYGRPSLEMSVVLPAPWVTIGIGTYRDLYLLALTALSQEEDFNPEWECEIQQHEVDPTRFRWKSPYGENFAKYCAANGVGELDPSEYDSKGQYNVEFVCDPKVGLVVVPMQSLGFQFFSDGIMYVCNEPGLYLGANSYDKIVSVPEVAELCGQATFDEKGQLMTVYSGEKLALVSFDPSQPQYYGGYGYQWRREGVSVNDYSIAMSYEGVLNTPDENSFVLANISLGKDVASAKAGLVKTEDIEAAVEAVASDAVETQELADAKKFTGLRFPYDGSANYVLAVVAYNEEGEEVGSNAITFFVVDTSAPKEWKKLGTGIMVDGWMVPSFSVNGAQADPMKFAYYVDMEENIENPGVYRILNPWTSEGYPGASLNDNKELKANIVVDARDAQFVTMAPQYSGFDMQGFNFWVSSIADAFVAQGYSKEQITAASYNNFVEEGEIVIAFPTWDNLKTTTDAPEMCGKTWYTDEAPYSPELEVCPGIFALPEAAQATMAKVHMSNTANRILSAGMNVRMHRAAKTLGQPKAKFAAVKRSAKLTTIR